jgi:hypothetical protein
MIISKSSHLKVLCTCPDEVYKLWLEITKVEARSKTATFQTAIGAVPKEGFYEESAYVMVNH